MEANKYYYQLEKTETINEGKFTDIIILLDNALDNGNISTDLYNTITKVNEMIFYEKKSEEILDFVNSLSPDEFSETDRPFVETFVSVYKISFEYWKQHNTQNKLSQTDATIIADAVGALHGLILAPVVSIRRCSLFYCSRAWLVVLALK